MHGHAERMLGKCNLILNAWLGCHVCGVGIQENWSSLGTGIAAALILCGSEKEMLAQVTMMYKVHHVGNYQQRMSVQSAKSGQRSAGLG